MASRKVEIRSHTRQLKSGKQVVVARHRASRKKALLKALDTLIAGQGGPTNNSNRGEFTGPARASGKATPGVERVKAKAAAPKNASQAADASGYSVAEANAIAANKVKAKAQAPAKAAAAKAAAPKNASPAVSSAAERVIAALPQRDSTAPQAPDRDSLGRALPPALPNVSRGEYRRDTLSAAQKEAHKEHLANYIEEILDRVGDSQKQFSVVSKDGVRMYSPERLALHREIMQDLLEKADAAGVPREGHVVISGGLPGAGKTYSLENAMGLDTTKFLTINPDDFKEYLAERWTVTGTEDGKYSPMEMAAVLHEESSDMSKMFLKLAQDLGYNIIYDVTLGGAGEGAQQKHRKMVESFTSRGYRADGLFADIPLEMSTVFAENRYWGGWADRMNNASWKGGRFVPASVTAGHASERGHNSSNRDNFDVVKDLFQNFTVLDNSKRDGSPAPVLESKKSAADNFPTDPLSNDAFDPFQDAISELNRILEERRRAWYARVGKEGGS